MKRKPHQLHRSLPLSVMFVFAGFGFAQGLFGPIQAGDTEAFNAALQAGADINATDEYGQTPLMYAVTFNQTEMVDALIAAGADVNGRSLAGWTTLHYAARDASESRIIQLLLAAGADPTARNQDGDTPQDLAAATGNQVAAIALLGYDARDSNPQDVLPASAASVSVQAVVTFGTHSLALLRDGTVMAWGSNGDGQLGDGTTSDRPTPAPVQGLANVQGMAAGDYHSLALLRDGTVMAWGFNALGQLGNGTTTDRLTPAPVQGLANVQAIAAKYHSLALLRDGTVMAWGSNGDGELGDGTTTDRPTPTPVQGLANVQAIAAGSRHSLALLHDGTVMAWGGNAHGQLGDGTTTDRLTPTPVQGLANVQAIAAGEDLSLALLRDGTVVAWGWNAFGQLGDGTKTDRVTPTPADEGRVVMAGDAAASAAQYYTPHPETEIEVNEAADFTNGFQVPCPPPGYVYRVCVITSQTGSSATQLRDSSEHGLGDWLVVQGWKLSDTGTAYIKGVVNYTRNEMLAIFVDVDGQHVVYFVGPIE